MLDDQVVGFFLQLIVLFCSVVWGARTYFVARGQIKNGITPECSAGETPAVIFVTAEPGSWRFRFFSRAYAEQFAVANLVGSLTTLEERS
jgi:hypothetical protein